MAGMLSMRALECLVTLVEQGSLPTALRTGSPRTAAQLAAAGMGWRSCRSRR